MASSADTVRRGQAPLDDLWAKSAIPGAARGELLSEHTAQVLARLADLRQLRPRLARRLTAPRLWDDLACACVIHDFGKAAEGFQRQVRPGGPVWGRRHEVLSLAFVDWVAPDTEAQRWVAAAVASHHRDADEIGEAYPHRVARGDDPVDDLVADLPLERVRALACWLEAQRDVWRDRFGAEAVERWRPWTDVRDLSPGAFRERAIGAIKRSLSAYRALYRDLDPFGGGDTLVDIAMALRGSLIAADRLGSAHAGQLVATGLGQRPPMTQRLNLPGLRPHQERCGETAGSVVLRAPTGSGKTEAALLWAERQAIGRGGAPRLFYVLPFQASMNAMFGRLQRAFPDESIGLQHGRALHALYRLLLETEEDSKVAARKARLERRLARLNYHSVRVLSPYQLLKACYRLKGYESILTDAQDGLFILDEVHAYEPERLALLTGFMRYLAEHCHADFCVLSATLPSVVRQRLEATLPSITPIRASGQVFEQFRRHRLRLLDGDLAADGLDRVARGARAGRSVLVCCNTVRRAQEVYQRLSSSLGGAGRIELLHGGFNARDRLAKEALVLRAADASRPGEPVVLVATQVVEVSLDISFGTIFSDPAPLEALLQRFGRVNRRPTGQLADVHVFRQPDDGQRVYNAAMVRSTLAVLERHRDEAIDEAAVEEWLDDVYTAEIRSDWERRFEDKERSFLVGCLDALRPFQSDAQLEEAFFEAFDAIDVLPLSLKAEYDALMAEDPIRADALVVSIRHSEYGRLKGQGRIQLQAGTDYRPPIIDAPYSPEIGLQLRRPAEEGA